MVSTKGNVPDLADISMVCKFTYVFSKDLPRLPPVKEIEFGMDLATDTRPISRAPYKMALIELKELKTQL